MEEGIARGEKCVNIVDKNHRDERLSRLAGAGIDVGDQKRPGKSAKAKYMSGNNRGLDDRQTLNPARVDRLLESATRTGNPTVAPACAPISLPTLIRDWRNGDR